MGQNIYKLKFELHAEHSNVIGDKAGRHQHTFSIVLYLKAQRKMELYQEIEQKIESWLSPFQNRNLDEMPGFENGDTTLENIGNVFFEELTKVLQDDLSLLRLDIYETPVRTYSVTKELYDASINRVHEIADLHLQDKVQEIAITIKSAENGVKEKEETAESNEKVQAAIVAEAAAGSGNTAEQKTMGDHERTDSGVRISGNGWKKTLLAVLFILVSAVVMMYTVTESGIYPRGSDTLNHMYRGRLVYEGIKEGNWYILYDTSWYNGIELMRYWAPVPLYMLAGCLFLTGGNLMSSYILFLGALFVLGACGWLLFGVRYQKQYLAAFLGVAWFLLPDNMRVLFAEGNIPRAVVATLLPYLLYAIWQFLEEKRTKAMYAIVLLMALIALCHLMIAAMVGITTFLFVCFDAVCNKRIRRGIYLLTGMVLSFLLIGVWLVPALRGGLMGMSEAGTAQVMRDFFADGFTSLNPADRYSGELETFYYGIGIFIVGIIGMLFAGRKSTAGFITGLFLFFSTTNSLYEFYSKVPFHQFFWMIRFIPVGLGFTFLALLLWRNAKSSVLIVLCILLLIDVYPARFYLYTEKADRATNVSAAQMRRAENYGILQAKELTKQRMALFDLSSYGAFAAYMISAVEPSKDYTFGWAWQGAATAVNIVQLNSAYAEGNFYYLFDRCLLMGNDTVLLRIALLPRQEKDIPAVSEAAEKSGYSLQEQGADYLIYTVDTQDRFGTVTTYEAAAIGGGGSDLARLFPAFEELSDPYIDHYTFEELSLYKTIYLSDFNYEDKKRAEALVQKLSDAGVHIIIDMNHISTNDSKGVTTFLGVTAQSITLKNAYGQLTYRDESYTPQEFSSENADWNTVYLNGLNRVDGTVRVGERILPYVGSVSAYENITFLAMNLPYHLQLTGDETVYTLLEQVFGTDRETIPKREIVPLEIARDRDSITIRTDYENTNTALAYYDIFQPDREIAVDWYLVSVGKGTTVIRLQYPYLKQGMIVSLVGIILILLFLWGISKYDMKRNDENEEHAKEKQKLEA